MNDPFDRFNHSFFLERLKKSWTCERKFLIILFFFFFVLSEIIFRKKIVRS